MEAKKRIGAIIVALAFALATQTATAGQLVLPGEIIYDFTTNGYVCDPDDWNFFGVVTTDFGWDDTAEDGSGAFISGDWTLSGGAFMGSGVGIGPFLPGQPLCGANGSGIGDIDLDLSQGTGISMRVRLELPPGDFPPATAGQPGVRLQLQLIDSDGTEAVLPGLLSLSFPHVNRMFPPTEVWKTVTFYFDGLDWANDDAAVAGATPGLDLNDVQAMRIMWRRGATSAWGNVLHWDEIMLIDSPPQLWADGDSDGDVDLGDFEDFQRCFGSDLMPTHPETLLFDFETGEQGWQSFGIFGADSGPLVDGSVGQGRFHTADFDINTTGFGIVDISPAIDLSGFTGLKLDARMVDVPGQAAFSGFREFMVVLGIGETEFSSEPLTATQAYQTFEVAFSDMTPPPSPFHLSDPGMQIKLVVSSAGNAGVVEFDHDEVIGVGTVPNPCLPVDADYDGDVDTNDFTNFSDCHLGPNVNAGFFAWCY